MNTMQVLLIVSAMVLALHMAEAMNFRNKRAASVALEDYLASQVLIADEEEARARNNANVQSGIQQSGYYNTNVQSGIQQARRAAAAARRQNTNAQSGVAQSGGNNNNVQSGVQQGGGGGPAPAPHASLAAYLSSRKAPSPYKIATSLN